MPTGSSSIPRASFAPRSASMRNEAAFLVRTLGSNEGMLCAPGPAGGSPAFAGSTPATQEHRLRLGVAGVGARRDALIPSGRSEEFVPMPNRREFLALTATGALLKQSAAAQTADPRGLYRDYARCLPAFLSDLAEAAYQRRNTEIARLTTS